MSDGFLAMGGYAAYVWGSYGFVLGVFVWNWLAPGLRRRRLEAELKDDAP